MNRSKAILGVCLVFLFGVVTGVAISLRLVQKRVHEVVESGPRELENVIVRRLSHELELDGAQRTKIREITTETREALRAIRQASAPQVEKIRKESEAKIRALLTPEQLTKYDQLVAEKRDYWNHPPRHRRPPGGFREGPPRPGEPGEEGPPNPRRRPPHHRPPPPPDAGAPSGAPAGEARAALPAPESTPFR